MVGQDGWRRRQTGGAPFGQLGRQKGAVALVN